MRVAYVCADAGVPVFGTKGCSVHVQEIIKQFLQFGHEVSLSCLRTGGQCCLPSDKFHWEEFSVGFTQTTAERETRQRELAVQIATKLVRDKPDLVYERYSLWSSATMLQTKKLDIPTILEVNAPLIEEQQQHRELVHRAEAVSIRDQAFLEATTIVTVSEAVADYVREHLPLSKHSKVHVVPNGVDIDRFTPAVPPCQPNAQFTVGFLGTLKPWHGLESLLAAFHLAHQRRPGLMLRIIGDGPLRETLQRLVASDLPSIQSSVQWMGAIHPQDVPGHLTALNVAIAPYIESAGFYFSPLKVYEYMAAGRAIVASSIGQLQSVLEHGQNGLLYDPGNVSQMADCICQLADKPKLVARLGAQARSDAQERHSWQHTLQIILGHSAIDQATAFGELYTLAGERDHKSSPSRVACELKS